MNARLIMPPPNFDAKYPGDGARSKGFNFGDAAENLLQELDLLSVQHALEIAKTYPSAFSVIVNRYTSFNKDSPLHEVAIAGLLLMCVNPESLSLAFQQHAPAIIKKHILESADEVGSNSLSFAKLMRELRVTFREFLEKNTSETSSSQIVVGAVKDAITELEQTGKMNFAVIVSNIMLD